MARLSMNEMTTYRWSFEEDVTRYSAAGIPAIGVWLQKLSDFGEEKGIELLRESRLAVSNLLWAGGFTGSDGRSFRDSLQDACEAIELAEAIGAPPLVVYTGSRGGHTQNHARRLVCEALRELLPEAAKRGVRLAIEPMHPGCASEWTFLTTLTDALRLMDEVDHPNLWLAFDTYHLGHEPCALSRVAEIARRVAVVHLGDGHQAPSREQNRCLLGEGTVPLREILAALASGGYDGDFDVVLMGEDIEECDYQALLERSKDAFGELVPS